MDQRPDQSGDSRLEQMLDRLGERERTAPDQGFEARIAAAAARAASQTGPSALGGAGIFRKRWVGVAAAIVIVGGIGMVALMVRTSGVTANMRAPVAVSVDALTQDLDAWMDQMEAQNELVIASNGEHFDLPAGWGDLALDFWGDDDPVMGSSGWDIESF